MTIPFVPNTPDPYENQLSAWAKAKVAAGADPQAVDDIVQQKVHAYRASLGSKPLPEAPETGADELRGAVQSGLQGVTLGAGNKLVAMVRAVAPEFLGGTKGFDFSGALDDENQSLASYRKNHPVASTALEAAGSILPVLATGGAGAASEATGLAKAGQLAKVGAGYGAAQGALSANTLGDVIPGAFKGGVVGAVAAPVVGAVGGKIAQGVGSLAKRTAPDIMGSLGETLGTGPTTPEEKAAAALGGALKQGGVDPADAAAHLPNLDNSPTTALDLGSQPALKLARQARNVAGSKAGQTLDDFLSDRATGAGSRVEGALTDATGSTPSDVQLPVEELIARRAEEAKPLYDAAYAHGEIQDPETVQQIKTLLKSPIFAKAWQRGQNLLDVEYPEAAAPPSGIDPARWKELQAQGLDKYVPNAPAKAPAPTVQQIDYWKKGLDSQIESGAGSENAMSRNEARVYRGKLNDILDRVDQEVPAYAQARDSFRGNSELMEAADAGSNHFKPGVSADYLQRSLPMMSDGEQEAYQSNAINAAVQKIRTMGANPDLPDAGRGTNIVQRLMGTDDAGKRLRMLFPDDNSYSQFLGQMEQEAQYPKTNAFLRNQSSTAAQLAEGQVSPGLVRDAVMSARGSPWGIARLAGRGANALGLTGKMSPAIADEVARQSTLTGPALQDALRQMAQSESARQVARNRVQSLLGNVAAAQPGNP